MSTTRTYPSATIPSVDAPIVALRLRRLTFTSYVRFLAAASAAIGAVIGVVGFVAGLFGAQLFIRLLPFFHVEGLAAAVLGLVVMPVFFVLIGVVAAAVTYFPFNLVLRLVGGLVVEGEEG